MHCISTAICPPERFVNERRQAPALRHFTVLAHPTGRHGHSLAAIRLGRSGLPSPNKATIIKS